tara:strand:- start:22383 stop:22637 length:255 start_codon:yes stop_codon:yes gene_type:complete
MKRLITPKKIKKLAEKALKNKPTWKPSKGYIYLKDLEIGEMFTIGKTTGVLLECETNAKVVILESPSMTLGKTIIGAETEVIKK